MKDIHFRQWLKIALLIAIVILEDGCMRAIQAPIFSSTPNFIVNHDARITPSATPMRPTLAPTFLTPNPTITPLIGGGRTITFQEYNQTQILDIGEMFVIHRLPENSTIEVQDPDIISLVTGLLNPTQGDQEYQAVAS